MKFSTLKEFKNQAADLVDVVRYLNSELAASLRDLRVGLEKLTLGENFESFEASLTIPATSELAIRNQFRDSIPSKWISVRSNQAGLSVCDGDTEWSKDFVYLKNTAASPAILTVLFFK